MGNFMVALKKAYESYVKKAYSIIPVGKNKKPLIPSWLEYQKRLPTDKEIEDWWAMWPNANYGVVTGSISGITVIDLDYGKGESTPLNKFPPTFTVKTPSGGFHLYYRYSPEMKTCANQFAQFPHLDIRNDGGYVVGADSVTSYKEKGLEKGGVYIVENNVDVTDFPLYLFKKQHKGLSGLPNFKNLSEGDGRNEDLTSFVYALLSKTPQSEWHIVKETALAANSKFKDPLQAKEVEALFASMKKRVIAKTNGIDFIKNAKGNIVDNSENLCRILKYDPDFAHKFRFDSFLNLIEMKQANDTWRAFEETDAMKIERVISERYASFQKTPWRIVFDAVTSVASENLFDSAIEYLNNLKWDQTPRLDTWLSLVYGSPVDEYHKKVGANWLKGLVTRLLYPGCKFDYVLVLEGPQGRKKSTSLSILGGSWHVETIFTPDTKDFFMLFNGKAIIEFSEGESLSRTEVKRMKAVLTMLYDKYRPPYGRVAKDFPRRCVFAMTTNQDEYLKDETGNRRWLPVRLLKEEADVEWLKTNRDQLFAEAYYRIVELQESTYDFPKEETLLEQEKRQIKDPNEEIIFNWYFMKGEVTDGKKEEGISTNDAYHAIHGMFPRREMNKSDEMVLSHILRHGLFLIKERKMINGIRLIRYTPSPETRKIMQQVNVFSIANVTESAMAHFIK